MENRLCFGDCRTAFTPKDGDTTCPSCGSPYTFTLKQIETALEKLRQFTK